MASCNVFIEIDIKRPPGDRIIKFLVNGKTLDDEKEYIFSSLNFALGGKDGFSPFDKS